MWSANYQERHEEPHPQPGGPGPVQVQGGHEVHGLLHPVVSRDEKRSVAL